MVLRKHLSQSDNEEIITDKDGHGSVAVTLKNPYSNLAYAVVVTPQEADNAGKYEITSKTKLGFTIGVTSSEKKSTEEINAGSVTLTFNDRTQEVIDASGNSITFADANPDTVVRNSGDWTDTFAVGDVVTFFDDGSDTNGGTYTISAVVALTMTLTLTDDELSAEVNTTDTFTITIAEPTIKSTIVRASGSWETLFAVGETITVSDDGSDVNAGSYLISAVSTVTMTLDLAEEITQEANSTDTFTFVSDEPLDLSWIAQRNS